jgi:hypothetical protein
VQKGCGIADTLVGQMLTFEQHQSALLLVGWGCLQSVVGIPLKLILSGMGLRQLIFGVRGSR